MPPSAKRARLTVIHKPLDYRPIIHPPQFQPMPRLYMELIENKKKVRPELRNKEYVPKNTTASIGPSLVEADKINVAEMLRVDDEKNNSETETKSSSSFKVLSAVPKSVMSKDKKKGALGLIDLSKMSSEDISRMAAEKNGSAEEKTERIPENRSDMLKSGFPTSGSKLDDAFNRNRLAGRSGELAQLSKSAGMRPTQRPIRQPETRDDSRGGFIFEESSRDREAQDFDSKYDSDRGRDDREKDREYREDREEPRNDTSQSKGRDRLANILSPAVSGLSLEAVLSGQTKSEPFNSGVARPTTFNQVPNNPTNAPKPPSGVAPSLREISEGKVQTNKDGMRDVRFATSEEVNEESKKRDILFKFKFLKRTYKEAVIPEFSEHTPLNTLQREYDTIVRQLALDSTVEKYKKYLTIGFFVLEFAVANMLKLEEIRGFAAQQMVGLNQYEKILYLIGEQSALSNSKPWSPLVQLIVAILVNGAIFIGSKFMFRWTGQNIFGMLNQTAQSPPQQTSGQFQIPTQPVSQPGPQGFTVGTTQSGQKSRLRGPTINLEDLAAKKGA